MTPVERDAVLAAAVGAALVAALAMTESLSLLTRPVSAAAGVGAALVVEAIFVADTPAGALWEQRTVRVGSAVALLVGGGAAVAVGGPWIAAAACWGLVTYFALLGLLVAGVWETAA